MRELKRLYLFYSVMVAFGLFFSPRSFADRDSSETTRLHLLEQSLTRLEAEVEILKAQSKILVKRTLISFLDATYFGVGLSLVSPRQNTFSFQTDTGIGARVAVGHYFGNRHVGELSADWDLYPGLSLRYRYEVRNEDSSVGFGPILGVKTRVLNARPWDNYLQTPSEVKGTFAILGAGLGFPVNQVYLTASAELWINQQSFLVFSLNTHLHL